MSRDEIETVDDRDLRAFVARHYGVEPDDMALTIQPLRGGLESVDVSRVHVQMPEAYGVGRNLAFVVKRLEGEPSREAAIYERLVQPLACFAAPALLDVECLDQQSCRLYLEWVRPALAWPWRHARYILRVLEQLARLHSLPPEVTDGVLAGWNYEEELLATACGSLAFFEETRHHEVLASARRSLPAVRRVVEALPAMRRYLLDFPALGRAVLHGDVHSGNVLIKRVGGEEQPLFIDWGRARVGSPLEDVSSWLQSLGFWEPAARQRHDTLLAGYLEARGLPPRLSRELRDAYWLAAASNILAGPLQYYLGMALGARTRAQIDAALSALHGCLRIIRRADHCWRQRRARRARAPVRPGARHPHYAGDGAVQARNATW